MNTYAASICLHWQEFAQHTARMVDANSLVEAVNKAKVFGQELSIELTDRYRKSGYNMTKPAFITIHVVDYTNTHSYHEQYDTRNKT